MNNSNVVKMTLGLAFATIVTFVVNANDITPNANASTLAEVSKVKMQEEIVESTSSLQQKDFSKLLSEFDKDSNGSLSEEELSTGDNDALKIAFKNIDSNEDGQISSSEYLTH
jgi:Ca2+-binding EF-hand superfamily protein